MKKKRALYVLIMLATCCAVLALLFYHGILLFNNPTGQDYPVRGVDVSSYQGEIDWHVLAGQNIDFAFIKATEGSSHGDANYAQNYEQAAKTGLRIGAYHFFSYESPGLTQAQNFIATVEKAEGLLPPVVDVEFYGGNEKNPPAKAGIVAELTAFLLELEKYYGQKPIIYATEKSYRLYIAGGFADYDIWIRDVFSNPKLSDGRSWTFWQYTNREVLPGYAGQEMFIDMNVFHGSREDFTNYGR